MWDLGLDPAPNADCFTSKMKTKTRGRGEINMENLTDINWALLAPLIGLQLILMIVAFLNWLKQEETNGPKWMWLPIILFLSIIGPVAYFLFGRNHNA